jgi:ribosomal protein L5
MFIEIFPKLKKSVEIIKYKKIKQNAFSYELNELFVFQELETNYYLFNFLTKLNITIVTNTKTEHETYFLLKFLKLPFLK